jgi:ribosomal protein S18 acetylase RimI-like enzyme
VCLGSAGNGERAFAASVDSAPSGAGDFQGIGGQSFEVVDMEKEQRFSVRGATKEDAQQVLQCLQEAFLVYRNDYTAGAYADTVLNPQTFLQRLSEQQILIAVDQSGEAVGTMAYKAENGEGHIRGMAVRPLWQGRGVAEKLLEHVESALQELGCKVITLDTTRPLQRAIRFYEKNGFRATGEVASFFGMELLAYRKEL